MKETDFIKEYKKERKLKNIKDSKDRIEAFWEAVVEGLIEDEKVIFKGWGSFEIREKKERTFNNPKTQKWEKIEAFKKIVFKQGKTLKKNMN